MIDKKIFRGEVIDNLTTNILPYWIDNMVDPRGGFYGRRDAAGTVYPDAEKGAILNARILWSFSSAYRVLGKPEYLEMATRAKREIIDRFYDKEHGGVFWSINPDGTPHDTKKQFYALGFAIYGLSEYARATGDAEALDYAMRLFHDIESHSRDRGRGGYFEATTRDWQPIADMRLSEKDDYATKTMNTHLHIIEPYTNLLRALTAPGVSHDIRRPEAYAPLVDDQDAAVVREATEALLDVFFDRIEASGARGHLGLFFDDDWHRQDGMLSYGHDIEASWLLLETAQVLGTPAIMEKALAHTRRIAEAALEGRCVDGSMVYERHANGRYDNDKHWWVQAECVIGQVYLYCFHGMPDMLDKAWQTWRYIVDNIVDREQGEWHWRRCGTEIGPDDKVGFWKCPYHNSRMCLEVYERLGE